MPDLMRGLGALSLLVTLMLGIPALLLGIGPQAAPLSDWSRLNSLTAPDDGRLFLSAVLAVAWVSWAVFTGAVLLEVTATARNVPTPHLPSLRTLQGGVAALVAAAGLVFSSGHAGVAPSARPVAVLTESFVPPTHTPPALTEASAEKPVTLPTITVQRHDTLWSLAERHLGAGSRFREIVALNVGVPQQDGRELTSSHWIYPGWVLRLPADARAGTVSRSAETYIVRPGDTLSGIAQAELGHAEKSGDLFALNKGRAMEDGSSFTTPDLIRPGWVLALTEPDRQEPAPGTQETPERHADPERDTAPVAAAASPSPQARASVAPAPSVPSPGASGSGTSALSAAEAGAVLTLGLVTATGLVRELRRRRRQQQRIRQAGSRIPMPTSEEAEAERHAAVLEAPVTVDTAKQALRALAESCQASGRTLPEVLLVRLSPSSVRLQLAADDLEAVSPFEAEDARRWRLAQPIVSAGDDDPYPALVTLGTADSEVLLLNVECIGRLNVVDGEGDVARALIADAAVGPFSSDSCLVLGDGFGEVTKAVDPLRSRVIEDPHALRAELEARRDDVRRVLGPGAARRRHLSSEGLTPDIFFSRTAHAVDDLAWSGVCLISIGQAAEGEGCELLVDSPSVARLQPYGISFEPQCLTAEGWSKVRSLLVGAATPSAAPPDEDVRVAVAKALPEVPATLLDLRDDGLKAPRVLLLGRVHVEGADDSAAPHRRRRASELAAYLALHPGANGREIDEALWPGRRVEKSTRNPFISRARQWLGKAPDGEPYLPLVADGGSYRLRPEVSCDWHDFVRFSQLGLESGVPGATALSAALDLVRGRPFLGVDPATYTWAEADIQRMISAIVDVAHVLAQLRLEAGDNRGAQQAVARGLLAEPCSEILYRDAMKAALAAGDNDELERLTSRLRSEIALIDPDETFDDETIELLSPRTPSTR